MLARAHFWGMTRLEQCPSGSAISGPHRRRPSLCVYACVQPVRAPCLRLACPYPTEDQTRRSYTLCSALPVSQRSAEHSTTFWNALYSQFRALSHTPQRILTPETHSVHHCKPLMCAYVQSTPAATHRGTHRICCGTHTVLQSTGSSSSLSLDFRLDINVRRGGHRRSACLTLGFSL
jgi:hypothetical protein